MRHVSVRLDDDIYEMLEEEAKALKVPKSWIIRRALEYYLVRLYRKDIAELVLAFEENKSKENNPIKFFDPSQSV